MSCFGAPNPSLQLHKHVHLIYTLHWKGVGGLPRFLALNNMQGLAARNMDAWLQQKSVQAVLACLVHLLAELGFLPL